MSKQKIAVNVKDTEKSILVKLSFLFALEKRYIAVLHFNVSLMDLFLNIKE